MSDSVKPSDLGRLAYEARFASWGQGAVLPYDRLTPDQHAIWEGVADAVSKPQVAALVNALESMAFASATIKGLQDRQTVLSANQEKLAKGLRFAVDAMEMATLFVTSRQRIAEPGADLWHKALAEVHDALEPATSAEIEKCADAMREGEGGLGWQHTLSPG